MGKEPNRDSHLESRVDLNDTNKSSPLESPRLVVGVGSSAGGVEALTEFVSRIPEDSKNAHIIVQHLSPQFESVLPQILSRKSHLEVKAAHDGMEVTAGLVCIIPPNCFLSVYRGKILLEPFSEDDSKRFFPIDYFFSSLATEYGKDAVAVVLSGSGSDGTLGLGQVRKCKGYIVVQAPDSALFSGMPKSAISANVAHAILPVEAIASHIKDLQHMGNHAGNSAVAASSHGNWDLNKIFFLLKNQFGVDFACYRKDYVSRHIEKRIKINGLSGLEHYSQFISQSAKERTALRDDLLIGYTSFAPKPDESLYFENEWLPSLFKNEPSSGCTIRIWVVGCSTGEEALTAAILVDSYLSKIGSNQSYKVFASDIDERSLSIASRGAYPVESIQNIPHEWQLKYFEMRNGHAEIKPIIREKLVFSRHNVLEDPPFPKVDMVICRNVLTYFESEYRQRVFDMFKYSLGVGGHLILGPNEEPPSESEYIAVADQQSIYQCQVSGKFTPPFLREVTAPLNTRASRAGATTRYQKKKEEEELRQSSLYKELVHYHMGACLIFNAELEVEYFFGSVSQHIISEPGKSSRKLDQLLGEGSFLAVKELLSKLSASSEQEITAKIQHEMDSELLSQEVTITLATLELSQENPTSFLLKFKTEKEAELPLPKGSDAFKNNTHLAKIELLRAELLKKQQEIASVKNEMKVVVSQLETSNDRLNVSNEELQAGAEELQSMNEELQAVNEELYTVNAECQMRISELTELNDEVQQIYEVSEISSLFIDSHLALRKFNTPCKELLGISKEDIGRPIESFSQFANASLVRSIKAVLKSNQLTEREFTLDDNQTFALRIAPYRIAEKQIEGVVLVFVDMTMLKQMRSKLDLTRTERDFLSKNTNDLFVKISKTGRILNYNQAFLNETNCQQNTNFFDIVSTDKSEPIRQTIGDFCKSSDSSLFFTSYITELETVEGQFVQWKCIKNSTLPQNQLLLMGSCDRQVSEELR